MILNGNNLGERHRDLNRKVNEAVAKQTNFEKLRSEQEKCDVDKLFKIDLASKYKNIDYILEILKCGDTLYITRALKCLWLYADEYSQVINPSYLETNIFPSMSMKIKRKILSAISMHIRNAERAIDFYEYCVDAYLNDNAVKFLIFTSDEYKLDLLKIWTDADDFDESKYLTQFIGSSLELALSYLALRNYSSDIIHKLRYLYFVAEEWYLNILEKYIRNNATYPDCSHRLGIRISKDILNKHKQRILNKPVIYVNILNKSMLAKHLTCEDVESLGSALLPSSYKEFWALDVYNTYKFIFEKIPTDKLYTYMKKIYISKYNGAEFQTRIDFFKLKYYEMLNIEEREAWALQHIERNKELSGIKIYMWYKFVSFRRAFSGIRRYIFLTANKHERSQIINIIPETARNQDDIRKILSYYYVKHAKEGEEQKERFIDRIIELYDIYSFNNECWTILDKLFCNYKTGSYQNREYTFRSLIYHILHEKELPTVLHQYTCLFDQLKSIIEKLSEERKAIVAKYLLSCYAENIKSLMDQPDNDTVIEDDYSWKPYGIKDQIHDLVSEIDKVIYYFGRPEDDRPEIAVQFMKSNISIYKYHEKYKTTFAKQTEEDFVRWLKKDKQMAIDGISKIRCNTYRWNFRLSRLFRKLKVYFADDVGKEYLKYFKDYLSNVPNSRREYRNIKMAVVGVYYLADSDHIAWFLENNAPIAPKIDHMNIDNRVLQVQKAICRLAYHSRPPLPLSNIHKYITRDYVHYCFPFIYNYLANLPCNEKFIESLLNTPLSIQKHGIRLAFRAYNVENLKPIIKSAWKKTNNVSLRMVLYEILFDRILNESKNQKELYEVLKLYTSELNHDDHDNVYALLISDYLPDEFKGDFIETAWLTVSKLSNKCVDIKRRISIIRHMEKYIHLVQRDFIYLQIIDNHVSDMLRKKNIIENCEEYYFEELIDTKWSLTAKYIVNCKNGAEQQKSLKLMRTIMLECRKSWNLVKQNIYIIRKFMQTFIKTIMNKDPKNMDSCVHIGSIYQCILDNLQSFLKKEQIYLMYWELKLSIICRNFILNYVKKSDAETDKSKNKYDIREEIPVAYAQEVANMIISLNESDEFYRCFYQSIADIVENIGGTVCDILGIGYGGFDFYVCDSLIDIRMTETHLLALHLLPRDGVSNWGGEIISKISKQFVSQEVRNYFYEKYILSDCQVRRYVIPPPILNNAKSDFSKDTVVLDPELAQCELQ